MKTVASRKPPIVAPTRRAASHKSVSISIPPPQGRIKGVVGQEKAVAYLERELRNIEKGQPLPWFAMWDDVGLGKTFISKAFLAALPKDVRSFSLNLKDHLNISEKPAQDYFHHISMALGEGIRTIIHLDEFGNKGGSGSLQEVIMAHISKIADDMPLTLQKGLSFPFDPLKLGFIVSSFAPTRAAVDIIDRLKQPAELILSNYSPAELVEILEMAILKECERANIPPVKFTHASLAMIARSLRGNARQTRDVAVEVRKSAADNKNFSLTLDSAERIIQVVGVFPHGLNQGEVKILSTLATGPKRKDVIVQKTGVERAHFSRAMNFLQEGTGRGEPFQLCKEDGSPVLGAAGSLIDYDKTRFSLTSHGKTVVAMLQKKGWIA